MDGIVIWVDHAENKAVIWCSDHGDLAYAMDQNCLRENMRMPDVGTMVSCKSQIVNGMRLCSDLVPVQRFVAPELPEALRELAAELAA